MPSYTTIDGLNIAYRTFGSGRPLVLVHGWMVSGAVFDPIIEALAGAGFELFIPDQRGTGDSAQPPYDYTLANYTRDLLGLIEAVGLKKFDMLGHSMGGQIAQLAAIELGDRVENLVLMCSVPAVGVPLPDELRLLFRTCGNKPEAKKQILGMACKQLDDAGLEHIMKTSATCTPMCIAEGFEAWTAGGFQDQLGKISAAKTWVIGTDDPFLPPEVLEPNIVEPIANAEFVHVPGPGHYPQVEAPDVTSAKLIELLGARAS